MLKTSQVGKSGYARGKAILIGEHAVVYGYPAVVLPLTSLDVTATVKPVKGPLTLDCALYRGPLAQAPGELQGLGMAVSETLNQLGSPLEGLCIHITSALPPGRGLGSSAAVAAAVIQSLTRYHSAQLSHVDLMALINIAEVHAHGTPSGIDSQAVVSESPLWFVKGEPAIPLAVKSPLHFLVADSGQSSNTRSAVESVCLRLQSMAKKVYANLERLGELAHIARAALTTGDSDTLGQALNSAQRELASLGLSHPALNRLILAANQAGALGTKLTGSGRGGCIVALARDAHHAEGLSASLMQAGAHAIWRVTLPGRGLKSE